LTAPECPKLHRILDSGLDLAWTSCCRCNGTVYIILWMKSSILCQLL